MRMTKIFAFLSNIRRQVQSAGLANGIALPFVVCSVSSVCLRLKRARKLTN